MYRSWYLAFWALIALISLPAAASTSPSVNDFVASAAPEGSGVRPLRTPQFIKADIFEQSFSTAYLSSIRGIGVILDGKSKFYPLDIIEYHLVITDGPYTITYSPLTRVATVSVVSPVGVQLNPTGRVFMCDTLMMFNTNNENQMSPALSGQFVISNTSSAIDASMTLLPNVSASFILWYHWKSLFNSELLVLSQDTGFPRRYYNTPQYSKYYASSNIIFPTPFDPHVYPYNFEDAKSTAIVVSVGDDVRVYSYGALLSAPGGFVLVTQGGRKVLVAIDIRNQFLAALEVGEDNDTIRPDDAFADKILTNGQTRWNLWGSVVDETGAVLASENSSALTRPAQQSMFFFSALSMYGTRPMLLAPQNHTSRLCWELVPHLVSAESLLGVRNMSLNNELECINKPRIPFVIPSDSESPSLTFVAVSIFIVIALAAGIGYFMYKARIFTPPMLMMPNGSQMAKHVQIDNANQTHYSRGDNAVVELEEEHASPSTHLENSHTVPLTALSEDDLEDEELV